MLAAGASTRFGPGGGKLLTQWRGRTLLQHVLATLTQAQEQGLLDGGVVVHPPNGEAIRDLAVAAGFDAVLAARAEQGVSESLKAGMVALEAATAPDQVVAALVVLADQPRLTVATIAALVAANYGASARLIRPRYQADPNTPGHPVLVGRSHWHLVDETEGDRGLDPVLAKHGLGWREVDVEGDNPDVDTHGDLARLDE